MELSAEHEQFDHRDAPSTPASLDFPVAENGPRMVPPRLPQHNAPLYDRGLGFDQEEDLAASSLTLPIPTDLATVIPERGIPAQPESTEPVDEVKLMFGRYAQPAIDQALQDLRLSPDSATLSPPNLGDVAQMEDEEQMVAAGEEAAEVPTRLSDGIAHAALSVGANEMHDILDAAITRGREVGRNTAAFEEAKALLAAQKLPKIGFLTWGSDRI